MHKFRVFVEGGNFILRIDNKIERCGFFTTRFVNARNSEEAGALTKNLIKSELECRILNEQSNPPTISIKEVFEIDDFGENHSPGAGFTWFTENEKYH